MYSKKKTLSKQLFFKYHVINGLILMTSIIKVIKLKVDDF